MEETKQNAAVEAVAKKLLRKADQVLDEAVLNPQALKHISGILKDVRDILNPRDGENGGVITFMVTGEGEDYVN